MGMAPQKVGTAPTERAGFAHFVPFIVPAGWNRGTGVDLSVVDTNDDALQAASAANKKDDNGSHSIPRVMVCFVMLMLFVW